MTNDVASARDFVGYGETPPDVCWPGGGRLAVNVVLNYEEGSEYSIEDGDGRSDATLTEVAQARVPPGLRDLAAESMFEYGSRVGFWRIYRLFRERRLPLTVFAAALALERNPAAARAIAIASSAPRPKTNGSPPLTRATILPRVASRTIRRSMNACGVDLQPPRLPTAITRASGACSRTRRSTRSSTNATSTCASARTAFNVRSSGSPGPAPMR